MGQWLIPLILECKMIDNFFEYAIKFSDRFSLSKRKFYKLENVGAKSLRDYFMYYRCQINLCSVLLQLQH